MPAHLFSPVPHVHAHNSPAISQCLLLPLPLPGAGGLGSVAGILHLTDKTQEFVDSDRKDIVSE